MKQRECGDCEIACDRKTSGGQWRMRRTKAPDARNAHSHIHVFIRLLGLLKGLVPDIIEILHKLILTEDKRYLLSTELV